MSTVSKQKQDIFGGIAALKALTDQSLNKVNGITSFILGEANNIMSSLLEIFNQLGGYNELIQMIENVLNKGLDDIETTIKGTIKTAIKQIISCGVEPTIDSSMILTGVTFSLKNIDPLSLLTIQPESENGQLVYFDNENGFTSKDFNVFLYSVISEGISNPSSIGHTWYNEDSEPILNLSYQEYTTGSTNNSNVITIKINSFYEGKKLSSFISDYLDSVKLFNNTQLLSSIFDDIMGSKIFSLNKTVDQLAGEKIIQKLCADILNNVNESDVIDDSFYIFSNDTYNSILEEANNKKKGIFTYAGDTDLDVVINQTSLMNSLLDLKNTDSTKISDQTNIIKTAIDNITNDIISKTNIPEKDKFALKLDFIQKIISELMSTITMFIFSPKIIYLFIMTSKLLGIEDTGDIVQFIKNNINIFKIIIIKIRDLIVAEITKEIKNMLLPLISQTLVVLTKEKLSIYKKQIDGILSLIETATTIVGTAMEFVDSGLNEVQQSKVQIDQIKK